VLNLRYSAREQIKLEATGTSNLEEAVVEGGEHGREGGPHPTPRGSPVQALRRGGPQVITRALQRPLPMCALRGSSRDHGGAPPRARRRHNGDAGARPCDPVRDRRHVRRHACGVPARPACRSGLWPVRTCCCALLERMRGNFSRGIAGLPCAWASGCLS